MRKEINIKFLKPNICFAILVFSFTAAQAQQTYWDNVKNKPSTLGIEKGFLKLNTTNFNLKLVKASQTIAQLSPKNDSIFDFTPSDRLPVRDKDSMYQLGDITFRIRKNNETYKSYSTAWHRQPVQSLKVKKHQLAAADLANTLPKNIPIDVKRFYEVNNNQLVIRFEITNKIEQPIEIGALGVPMVFNNILVGKELDQAHAQNVFFDPYIGMDAGYLEVKKLNGKGPVLLVLPEQNMPFEAYRPLLDELTRKSIVFEGFHEWMPLSKAYAEDEWKGVKEWNKATSLLLQPNEHTSFAIRFVLANSIKEINKKLLEEHMPIAVSTPGYVLPQDVKSSLFLKYNKKIDHIEIYPERALTYKKKETTLSGYVNYEVCGVKWGMARLTVAYTDGKKQSINYKVIKPETQVVQDFGNFLFTHQWFDKKNDVFGRNPSLISYDYEKKKQKTQDSRAWIVGLSDEGGAGSWLGGVMKQLIEPNKNQIQQLEHFIDSTLWGRIQYKEGKNKFGVKKSVFFYEPDSLPKGTYSDSINYKTWAAWSKKVANDPGRSYNYPHVASAYWVMYRLARYHQNLVTNHSWQWYLEHAFKTAQAMPNLAPYYAQFGQMEGSVFLFILKDLQREGLNDMANSLETEMKKRANHWKTLNYPFGSEMPWDSTGQEEVFMWSDYFGYNEKANVTLEAILAYMPTMPNWAYNGNARRYWDFLYGGKLARVERQIHHYGSGLNAIPVLKGYREHPDDFYLLKVGYGGVMGAISNITQDGFGSAAFHSYPSTMQIDYLSGDYGSGFYGYAVNTATYITKSDDFGWLTFGGNLEKNGDWITIDVTTAAKNKIYLAPEKLCLTLNAGTFSTLKYNTKTKVISFTLNAKNVFTPFAYLASNKKVDGNFSKENGLYKIELNDKPVQLTISGK
ncbi:DUF5695 domain-containing protein [Zhouia sp. PK063]|uniref:DUF5695 domain-containing protein n=1 Tax=Zhouia sp. PK063 TaxID=3373602 RepID=UPI0037B02335